MGTYPSSTAKPLDNRTAFHIGDKTNYLVIIDRNRNDDDVVGTLVEVKIIIVIVVVEQV